MVKAAALRLNILAETRGIVLFPSVLGDQTGYCSRLNFHKTNGFRRGPRFSHCSSDPTQTQAEGQNSGSVGSPDFPARNKTDCCTDRAPEVGLSHYPFFPYLARNADLQSM